LLKFETNISSIDAASYNEKHGNMQISKFTGVQEKRKMNEFKERKNGKGRFLRLPRLSYRDETIRVTFAM
jgi:hypothetical protein